LSVLSEDARCAYKQEGINARLCVKYGKLNCMDF